MTLAEFMNKPLVEALGELKMVDSKTHTDDDGNIITVELKYKDPCYGVKMTAPTATPKRGGYF